MKSPSMPTPLSAIGDGDAVDRAAATRTVTGVAAAGVDRVLERDGRPPARARPASTSAHSARVAEQLDVAIAALGGDGRGRAIGRSGCGLDPLHPRRRVRREAGEQLVHLADRGLQRRDHVGAELGIVGVALGVAGEQRQLADQILDVVEDEGEAAVELLEPLRIGERFLAHALRRASSPPGCRRCGAGRNPPSRAGGGIRARRGSRGRPAARWWSSGTPAHTG